MSTTTPSTPSTLTAPPVAPHLRLADAATEAELRSRSVPDIPDRHLGDHPEIRPRMGARVGFVTRLGTTVAALGAGAGAAALAGATTGVTAHGALTAGVVATGLLTAVAANWSTCGMSVAGVVAAPKQEGRPGASTPVGRLLAHLAGSLLTSVPTGLALGGVGWLIQSTVGAGSVPWAALLGIWAVIALAYGLHESDLVRMPTPMRRVQLPRHLRRAGRPARVSFYFGMLIGPGFMIFIRSAAYYLLFLGVLALGDPLLGAALFALVSVGRCGPAAMAIVMQHRGRTMADFLMKSMTMDRMVQLSAGVGLTALAGFAGTALLF
nr:MULTISPECIES: methylamine utilization protein [Corynebacterium]